MAERKYYCFCGSNCRYETLTKEQILTAIEQAITNGEITDIDSGFITTIKEQNKNGGLQFWIGTQAEYNAIETPEDNIFYIITDDTETEDLQAMIETLAADLKRFEEAYDDDFQHLLNLDEQIEEVRGRITTLENKVSNLTTADEYNIVAVHMGDASEVVLGTGRAQGSFYYYNIYKEFDEGETFNLSEYYLRGMPRGKFVLQVETILESGESLIRNWSAVNLTISKTTQPPTGQPILPSFGTPYIGGTLIGSGCYPIE